MRFQPLFTLEIVHSYYPDSCQDFEFVALSDTIQTLKNHRLLAKTLDGRLYVLFEADEVDTPLVPMVEQPLRFGLMLTNPYFIYFTELDFDMRHQVAVHQNTAAPTILATAQARQRVGRIFTHRITNDTRPVTVTLSRQNGDILSNQTIVATEQTDISFDLSKQPVGQYQVTDLHPDITETTDYYVDGELFKQAMFGVVEVAVDPTFFSSPPTFKISLSAKTELLEYYIVADHYTETDLNQLNVLDAGAIEESRTQINFSKILTADFGANDISPDLIGSEISQIALFRSQATVPRQSQGRKKIQLHQNGDVLMPHLPQPSAQSVDSTLIVRIAKPKP